MEEMKHDELKQIRERLKAGKLTPADVKKLEEVVLRADNAVKALRAAMVE